MQCTSEQLLTRSALADEQDRRIAPRGPIDECQHIVHGSRLSHDACDVRTHTKI
jgi:hypothetical protein